MAKELADKDNLYLRMIYILSAAIPLAVAFLILTPWKLSLSDDFISWLPDFHAIINSLTVLVLLVALASIKSGKVQRHKKLMFVAFILGTLFLVSYVLYHASVDSVKYGDVNYDGALSDEELAVAGISRTIYLTILISHIVLSIGVVPFVLMAFYYALTQKIEKHQRIVKVTFPLWLYVSITGVIVYLMIKPYYL